MILNTKLLKVYSQKWVKEGSPALTQGRPSHSLLGTHRPESMSSTSGGLSQERGGEPLGGCAQGRPLASPSPPLPGPGPGQIPGPLPRAPAASLARAARPPRTWGPSAKAWPRLLLRSTRPHLYQFREEREAHPHGGHTAPSVQGRRSRTGACGQATLGRGLGTRALADPARGCFPTGPAGASAFR